MLLNTVIGFIIPWIFGGWLIHKNKKLVFIMFPFSSIVSHTINSFGIHIGYWKVKPINNESFSALPFDLGFYGLAGCFLIYIIEKTKLNPYVNIFIFCLVTTIFEFIGVISNRIIYGHGWSIFYTFFSYLIAYVLVYWYYSLAKKLNIFN